MFVKVERISHDSYGKEYERETIINTDLITSVKEMVVDTIKYYDEDGNFVKEEENDKFVAHVYMTTGPRIVLDKHNYDLLVEALVK